MTNVRRVLAVGVAVGALSACGSGALPLLPTAAGSGAAADSKASAMSAMAPYFSVHYSLSDDFKASLPNEAKAYELDKSTSASAISKLAKAFGVPGRVAATPTEWTVSGGGQTLRVNKTGGLPFSLNGDMAVSSGYACAESGGSTSSSGETPPQAPDQPADKPADKPAMSDAPADSSRCASPPVNPDLPTKAKAEQIARAALVSAGIDLDGAKTQTDGGYDSWTTVFTHTLDGVPTSALASTVMVGPKGKILSAYGQLGQASALGDYPLVTPAEAVERLNAQGASGTGDTRTLGAPEPAIAADAASGASVEPSPGAPPDCNDPTVSCLNPNEPAQDLPVEPQTRELQLTSATMTLLGVGNYEPDSPLTLVPAYSFRTADGAIVEVEAVTDRYLTRPQPTPKPLVTDPGAGGDGGSSSGRCAGIGEGPAAGKDEPGNAPLEAEVCASPAKVKVGDTVVFTITAKDADGSFVEGPCEAPVQATFGDSADGDGDGTVNCMACAQATEGKHSYETTLKHTYTKAGSFKAVFSVHSGSSCDPRRGDSKLEGITVPVEVTG